MKKLHKQKVNIHNTFTPVLVTGRLVSTPALTPIAVVRVDTSSIRTQVWEDTTLISLQLFLYLT